MPQNTKDNGAHDSGATNRSDHQSKVKNNSDPDERREEIPASTRFMPQSGKPAEVQYDNTKEERDEQREDISAGNRFMPQAGKPTGSSSL